MPYIRTVRGKPRPDVDRYLISYPKVGRTWLRALLGKALVERYGLPGKHLLETGRLVAAAGLPSFAFDHDGASIMDGLSWRELDADKSAFRDKHVLLLGRDVRDTLVSAYLHATRRLGIYDGTISAFVRDERYGVDKVLAFYRQWWDARSVPRAFAFLRYEALHATPVDALRRALDFLGATAVDDAILGEAVRYATFENMRKAEASDTLRTLALRPATPDDPESFKVRRGRVGGYAEYLSAADVAYIDARESEAGCEFTRPQVA